MTKSGMLLCLGAVWSPPAYVVLDIQLCINTSGLPGLLMSKYLSR